MINFIYASYIKSAGQIDPLSFLIRDHGIDHGIDHVIYTLIKVAGISEKFLNFINDALRTIKRKFLNSFLIIEERQNGRQTKKFWY